MVDAVVAVVDPAEVAGARFVVAYPVVTDVAEPVPLARRLRVPVVEHVVVAGRLLVTGDGVMETAAAEQRRIGKPHRPVEGEHLTALDKAGSGGCLGGRQQVEATEPVTPFGMPDVPGTRQSRSSRQLVVRGQHGKCLLGRESASRKASRPRENRRVSGIKRSGATCPLILRRWHDGRMLSFPVPPMKAGIGTLPPDDDRWAYEIKWDGYRTLAFIDDGIVRLQSTKGLDVTDNYPELSGVPDGVHAAAAILDAELVVLGEDGKPRFELVQQHRRQAALFFFDVLRVENHDTIDLAYEDRRRLLEQVVEPGDNWAVPSYQIGDGAALLAVTLEQDLEGVMAKRLGSTYVPGKRSPNWRKIKNRRKAEVVIGGFSSGGGNRTGTFGSLLVGRYDGDRLAFAGGVGTGFNQKMLAQLTTRLGALLDSRVPVRPAATSRLPEGCHVGAARAAG